MEQQTSNIAPLTTQLKQKTQQLMDQVVAIIGQEQADLLFKSIKRPDETSTLRERLTTIEGKTQAIGLQHKLNNNDRDHLMNSVQQLVRLTTGDKEQIKMVAAKDNIDIYYLNNHDDAKHISQELISMININKKNISLKTKNIGISR
ncbi:hypothetical protein [Candidatus Tisiphia endosymbiont of Nemotelus uliginosus]|uniref:hypothetical protein n=1 Tax=Candidatus Tisiphia endosymbiont of Nemotelus uliginosus TaxID=3077926 RepID=UPI0035C89A20